MSFTKFVAMLDSSCLFFCRTDLLGDPLEGSFPKRNLTNPGLYGPVMVSNSPVDSKTLSDAGKDLRNLVKNLRKAVYANCWHINESESHAMWRVFVSASEGVAIESSPDRLRQAIRGPKADDLVFAKVKYIDYDNQCIKGTSVLEPFMHKRKSFEHEREFRAFFHDKLCWKNWDSNQGAWIDPSRFAAGHNIPVNLKILVASIHVSPLSPPWFMSLVEATLKKYSLKKRTSRSFLDAEPLW